MGGNLPLSCTPAVAAEKYRCDLRVIEPRERVFVEDYFTPGERQLIYSAAPADRSMLTPLVWWSTSPQGSISMAGGPWRCVAAAADLVAGGSLPGRWFALPTTPMMDTDHMDVEEAMP